MPVNLESTVAPSASPANEVPPVAAMVNLLFGKHITYSLSALARLGVPDHMSNSPVWVGDLALAVGAHGPSLYRVMRMLASLGIFNEVSYQRFALTPVGELLRSDVPGSLRYLAIQFGDQWSTRAFENFTDTLRTGTDGISQAYGKNVFDVLAGEPEQAANFNRSMTAFSAALAEPIIDAYDFSSVQRLADVGGGHGKLLAAVLDRNPKVKGVVYDLPEVVAGALSQPHFSQCADRVEVEAGSFFQRVPAGCDTYMMKSILHDWSDDHCRTILSRIREQLAPDSRVLVCEQVVGTNEFANFAKCLDLEMLVMTVGGRERTLDEFKELFASVGLKLTNVYPTKSPMCVLEARLASAV